MNHTKQPENKSSNLKDNCWFCNARALPSSSLKLQFGKSFIPNDKPDNRSDPLYSVKVEFIDQYRLEIYIPRCTTCKTIQTTISFVKKSLYYSLPIIFLVIFIINIFVAFFVFISLALLYQFRKFFFKLIPGFINRRFHDYAFQHPEVKKLRQAGWF
jgi:hypothetical protein